jgi:hypothetical protein
MEQLQCQPGQRITFLNPRFRVHVLPFVLRREMRARLQPPASSVQARSPWSLHSES